MFLSTKRGMVTLGAVGFAVVVVTLLLVFLIPNYSGSTIDPPDPESPLPPSDAIMGIFDKAAVVANGYICAPIGRDIMAEGGNAVDAAIGTLLCDGVTNIQSMGVGGGFLMTIYLKDKGTAVVLNARETAPALSDEEMFHGNSTLSQKGGLSVAIPGELRGYQEAFDKYGSKKISWERLFQPTIDICKNGFKIQSYLANILKKYEDSIVANPGLSEFLVNPATGHVLVEGDLLKRSKLAKTLEIVSKSERADAIYNGTLTDGLVKDIQDAGGIITREDLEEYQVQWQQPVRAVVADHEMYSSPLPGSGAIVAFILNILSSFIPGKNDILTYHRIVEAFKFGYGRRTELGDNSNESFVPNSTAIDQLIQNLTSPAYAEYIRGLISDDQTHSDPAYYGAVLSQFQDHGTAHVSVLAPNGDAVSVTSTINLVLGSGLVSTTTGILLNDEMDDFSAPNITNAFGIPPSPANFIKPGKRPLSSMCPTIFTQNNEVKLITGAAGGSKITTTTVLIAIQNLIFGRNIKESIDAARLHHQLFPMSIDYEYGLTADIVAGLKKIGHEMTRSTPFGSSVTGISRDDKINACYDFRRGGSAAGF